MFWLMARSQVPTGFPPIAHHLSQDSALTGRYLNHETG